MVTRDRGNRDFVIERPYSLKKKKEGQKGTGGSVGKSKEKKDGEQSLGTRLAAARRVKPDKKSFWS